MNDDNNIERRSFLKYLGLSSLIGACPSLYAKTLSSDNDVEFLERKHKLFESYRKIFNKRIKSLPNIIAVCSNEAGVKKAIHYANTHKLNISIKSGGHSFEGFSLNEGGLVIDLSKMNQLKLDSSHQLTAEPAVRLAQLYEYCFSKRRLLPSGSCATVGLAGITLGGGYGLFSRQFGLTCDYLTGVRMIDANGNVVDSDKLPELLWGCRGGGNGNFGVITQLRYNTVQAPKTLHQHRFRSFNLTPEKALELAAFWFKQCELLPSHAYSAFVLNGKTLAIMFTSTEDDSAMTKVLSAFDHKMDKNANLKPDPIEIGVKYYYGRANDTYFKNISAGYYNAFDDISSSITQLFTLVGQTSGMVFQINTLGGEINNVTKISVSAYPHRQARFLGEAQCYWEEPNEEKRSMAAMKQVQEILHKNSINKHYANYPDINIENYAQAYYGDSYKRLQKLKTLLDPNDIFSHPQSVKPA